MGREYATLEEVSDAGSQRHVKTAARHAAIVTRTHGKGSVALRDACSILREALCVRYGGEVSGERVSLPMHKVGR